MAGPASLPYLTVSREWTGLPAAVFGTCSSADRQAAGAEAMRQAFLDYLETVRVKPKDMHVHYNDWWTAPRPSSEQFVLRNLAVLKKGLFETTGFFFDSYALDAGWSNLKSADAAVASAHGGYQLRVLGKGRRERVCPLRSETASRLRRSTEERGLSLEQDAPLFISARGMPLTRFGVLRIVQRHARRSAKSMPALTSKRIGAHTFRHAAAIHLLRSGNDLTVVRSWLGQVSVETTHQYTEIDFQMKRKALEACQPVPKSNRKPAWKKDADLVAWLEALRIM